MSVVFERRIFMYYLENTHIILECSPVYTFLPCTKTNTSKSSPCLFNRANQTEQCILVLYCRGTLATKLPRPANRAQVNHEAGNLLPFVVVLPNLRSKHVMSCWGRAEGMHMALEDGDRSQAGGREGGREETKTKRSTRKESCKQKILCRRLCVLHGCLF